jgi:hypothetical protein
MAFSVMMFLPILMKIRHLVESFEGGKAQGSVSCRKKKLGQRWLYISCGTVRSASSGDIKQCAVTGRRLLSGQVFTCLIGEPLTARIVSHVAGDSLIGHFVVKLMTIR